MTTRSGWATAAPVSARVTSMPARPALRTVFVPLGRMALTHYLTATVLGIAGAILTIQRVWSTLWLPRYRQGPLEWLWRWVTWARRPPLRRAERSRPTVEDVPRR